MNRLLRIENLNKFNWARAFYLLLLAIGILFLVMYFCNHYLFRTYAWDYAAYNFGFYDFAHCRSSLSPVYHWPMKFIQDHVSFTLILFVPLYWLLSWLTGTYTLLIIQALIIMAGAWGVFKIVELKSGSAFLGFLGGLYYFVLFGRWPGFINDVNFAIIASSLVPLLMYLFEKRKWVWGGVLFLFILATREDMALWTFFIGIFFLVSYWRDFGKRMASISMMGASLIWFIIIFIWIIPAIETPERSFALFNYNALGEGPGEALMFMLRHPFKTISLLFVNHSGDPVYNGLKTEFYYVYLVSGGILLLLRPRYIILFIPLIAKKMLNDDVIRWSIELYYSIEFVSLLPVVVFLIIGSFRNKWLQVPSGVLVCLAAFWITTQKFEPKERQLPWWTNEKYVFWKKEFYNAEFDAKYAHELLRSIPDNAAISASGRILPHLAFREKCYFFPRVDDAEYLLLIRENDHYPLTPEEFGGKVAEHMESGDWIVLEDEYPLLVLKKPQAINTKEKPIEYY